MTLPQQQSDDCEPAASLETVVQSLLRTTAFPVPVEDVEFRQTHISAVFLGGDVVYKLKKPVKLPFLDFSSVPLRHHFCKEEVRINSPWAPGVYQGVVAVTKDAHGFRFEGDGPIVDWAVKMRRLPESVTLRSRLNDGKLEASDLERVACRIAEIHRNATSVVGDEAHAAVEAFRHQLNDNWAFAHQLPENVIAPQVLRRIRILSTAWLDRCNELLRTRAEQGWIRDVHGDLRLEHVFFRPEDSPPADIVILDGIEFDPALRRIDVAADVAFLTMELSFAGRRDLAATFADAYFAETGDLTGRGILPLFTAYRSGVRAKVAAILFNESEIPQVERDTALARSRSHWLWCLSELERPGLRPALVLVAGLPGTGKSTLSRALAANADFEVVRSDVVRKEIFAADTGPDGSANLYTSDRTQHVYNECLSRARRELLNGGRVIVDATFQREHDRQSFLQLAIECGSRVAWIECVASPEIARHRIESRRGDPSDADWSVYHLVQQRWQPPSEQTQRFHAAIDTGHSQEKALDAALAVLRSRGVAE